MQIEPQVEEATWTGSWAHSPSDVDKYTSDGLSGGSITFLVMLGITILLGLMCFIYYKKNGRYSSHFNLLWLWFIECIYGEQHIIPTFSCTHHRMEKRNIILISDEKLKKSMPILQTYSLLIDSRSQFSTSNRESRK